MSGDAGAEPGGGAAGGQPAALQAPSSDRPSLLRLGGFGLTLVTMCAAGLSMSPAFYAHGRLRALPWIGGAVPPWWELPATWVPGLGFALSLMAILFAHEMGHYLTARRLGVPMTWPLFVPFLPPLGTLGAVIAMTPATRDGASGTLQPGIPARRLLRIAAFGPFAGAAVALPVIVLGLLLSEVRPFTPGEGVQLGVSAVFWLAQALIYPDVPRGHDVFLHPVAMAGWAGCIVTSINLLPFGQLDGGHVAYCVFGEAYNRRRRWLVAALIGLVIASPGMALFALLIALVVRVRHPPITRGERAADARDRRIALGALLLFLVTFTPRPYLESWSDLLGRR